MGANLPLEFRSFANLVSERDSIRSSTRLQIDLIAHARRTTRRTPSSRIRRTGETFGRINTESLSSKVSSFIPRSSARYADSVSGDQESRKEGTEKSETNPEGPIVVCDDLDALLQVRWLNCRKCCSSCELEESLIGIS